MTIDIAKHDAIKRDLKSRGVKLVDISLELACPPSMVTMVSQGRRRSTVIEAAIATKLGTSARLIWPDRYKSAVATVRRA